jgi:hypothetical protein
MLLIYTCIVKAPSLEDALIEASSRLVDTEIIGRASAVVNDHEVKVLVQCPVEKLQAWYAEDVNDPVPYKTGSLLLFTPWSKTACETMNRYNVNTPDEAQKFDEELPSRAQRNQVSS